jgi:hypothetical protein
VSTIRARAGSSGAGRRGDRSPSPCSTGSTRSSNAARSRPAWPSPTAAACSCTGRWGLVSEVLDEATLATRQDHLAIGHTRDSTTGSWETAQPAFTTNAAGGRIVVDHHGNLTNNAAALAGAPDSTGITPGLARTAPGHQRHRRDRRVAGPSGRPVAGEGHRPHHGPPRGPHRDRRPRLDRSRQGAVHDLVYGGSSGPGPGCGGPGRHPPPTATQPSTLPPPNPELEVAR